MTFKHWLSASRFWMSIFVFVGFASSLEASNLPDPVEGVITIEGEVTVDDAAGAVALAGASAIVLTEGATLTYTYNGGDAHALNLTARFSGAGKFIARDASKVVLNADNSGMTAPGCFEFYDTAVDVANYNGLGGAAAGVALISKTAGNNQLLNFIPVNGCFTNNTPTKVLHISGGSNRAFIGLLAEEGEFVQAADLDMSSVNGESHASFRGHFKMIHGTLRVSGHVRLYRCKGADWVNDQSTSCPGSVQFLGDTYCNFDNNPIFYGSDMQFGNTGGIRAPGGLSPDSSRNVTFLKDYILGKDCMGTDCTFAPYENGNSGTFINMNGTTQQISWLLTSAHGQTSSAGISTPEDKPALLKAVRTDADKTTEANYRMTGPLSYWHATKQYLIFNFKRLESTGDLTISAGTVVFTNGSGWAGRKVTVKDGGTLRCLSTASLNSGKHFLTMERGGALDIGEDVELYVGTATFGDVTLAPMTTYTIAEVQALISETGVTLTGSGTLKTGAKSIPGEWTGWPEVGTATKVSIPDGVTAEILDADVAKVEALTDIDCGIDAAIAVRTTTTPLNLFAKLDGTMTVTADHAAPVVLWGDNSKLLSPGHFEFVETKVVVSNEFGLGSSNSGAAIINWAKGCADGNLVFGCESGHFTNNCALTFINEGNSKNTYFGSESEDEFFYQNADLYFDYSGIGNVYLTYNCQIIGGKVRANSTCNGAYIHHAPRSGIWGFFGSADVNFGSQLLIYDHDLVFDCDVFKATWMLGCAGDNRVQFVRNGCLTSDTVLRPYGNGTGQGRWMDFCGTTQVVSRVEQAAYNGANHSILISDAPALLKTCGTDKSTETHLSGICFAGALSYWHGSTETIKFTFSKSTSTGDLTVSAGTVWFANATNPMWNPGWAGKNVTVKEGGTLILDSVDSLTGGNHFLTVEPGGTLSIGEGVTLKVGTATFGEVQLEANTLYSVAEINELIEGQGVTLTGSGFIKTGGKSIPGTWEGWPEVGTATKVEIPDGTIIDLSSAEDIARVEALEEIDTGLGTVINYTGSEDLDLSAKLSGSVQFRGLNAGTVTIGGDNSGLIGSGGFFFSNTTAVVTSLYGLGTRQSAAVNIYPAPPVDSNNCYLWFDGEAVSNEVELIVHYNIRMGHRDPTVRFVQANTITHWDGSTAGSRRFGYTNDFTIASGVTANIYTIQACEPDAKFRIEDGAKVISHGIYGSSDWYIDGDYSGEMRLEQSVDNLYFGKDNAVDLSYFLYYDASFGLTTMHLNGHDQTLPNIWGNGYPNANQQTLWFDSDTPATVTISGGDKAGASFGFTGKASLTYAGTGVQTNGHSVSTSTGTLTVSSGTFVLERDAKWLGDVALTGGRLVVAPTASTNTFGSVRQSRTTLSVTPGAKLQLDYDSGAMAVAEVIFDGQPVTDKDVLSAANCDWIEGPGVLRIHRPLGLLLLVR